jgi:methyltransferase family protein
MPTARSDHVRDVAHVLASGSPGGHPARTAGGTMNHVDPDEHSQRLAAESLAGDDPTGWFERLYAQARDGEAVVPWARGVPNRLLLEWTRAHGVDGSGRRALVVGSGLGDDAEHVASLGFETVAFDVAPTAIALARRRFPDSAVRYVTADLLDPPAEWSGAFEFVVECINVQALPVPLHAKAIANVAGMVAPCGTLLVISGAREQGEPVDGPPWPLTRAEIDGFAGRRLRAMRVEDLRDPGDPTYRRWRAEYWRAAE